MNGDILNELSPISEDPVRDLADYFYDVGGQTYEGGDWASDSEWI